MTASGMWTGPLGIGDGMRRLAGQEQGGGRCREVQGTGVASWYRVPRGAGRGYLDLTADGADLAVSGGTPTARRRTTAPRGTRR